MHFLANVDPSMIDHFYWYSMCRLTGKGKGKYAMVGNIRFKSFVDRNSFIDHSKSPTPNTHTTIDNSKKY